MRVAVIGPGAIGLTFAAELAPYHDVVLCARRDLAPVRVERRGRETSTLDLPVLLNPEGLVDDPPDWVLLAVKAHQTPGAAGWLGALRAEAPISIMSNGVEHVDNVAPFVEGDALLPTIVWTGSELVESDRLVVKGDLRLVVPDSATGESLRGLFDHTEVSVELYEDFLTEAWHKLIANAVAGLEVLAMRRAEMFHLDDVADLALALARECGAVARAEGANVTARMEEDVIALYRRIPVEMGTSMLYDRVADRPLEWDARNGVISRFGRRHGIPTPVSDVLVPLLRAGSPDSYEGIVDVTGAAN